jgi:hypothetical protein
MDESKVQVPAVGGHHVQLGSAKRRFELPFGHQILEE